MRSKNQLPRGIRNNNPLNIRIGNDWQGEVNHPDDKDFEQFEAMKYGCRAAFIILHNYMIRHKLVTVPDIVKRWAPSSENATDKYIKTVLEQTKFEATTVLSWWNKEQMCRLFLAMCYVENGVVIDVSAIEEGYDLAVGRRVVI